MYSVHGGPVGVVEKSLRELRGGHFCFVRDVSFRLLSFFVFCPLWLLVFGVVVALACVWLARAWGLRRPRVLAAGVCRCQVGLAGFGSVQFGLVRFGILGVVASPTSLGRSRIGVHTGELGVYRTRRSRLVDGCLPEFMLSLRLVDGCLPESILPYRYCLSATGI